MLGSLPPRLRQIGLSAGSAPPALASCVSIRSVDPSLIQMDLPQQSCCRSLRFVGEGEGGDDHDVSLAHPYAEATSQPACWSRSPGVL